MGIRKKMQVEAVMKHGEQGPMQALFPPVCNAKRIISDLLTHMIEEEIRECVNVEDREQQQRSPNSVLSGVMLCTPTTSSSSSGHDDAGSCYEHIREAKKPRTNSSNQSSISFAASVSMKRRKSTPHRSPIS